MKKAEWAMAGGVALLLASVIFSTVWKIHELRKIAMARTDIAALERAIHEYYAAHARWPIDVERSLGTTWGRDSHPNRHLMRPLLGVDSALGDRQRPWLKVRAWEPGLSGLSESVEFLDPWGAPYRILLMDPSRIEWTHQLQSVAMAWSLGPDGRDDSPDDVALWRRIVVLHPQKYARRPGR